MDLQKELLESSRGKSDKRSLGASGVSLALHGLLVCGILYVGSQNVTHKVDAEKPINAFISQGAAPPPPPPPPPPSPAKSSGAPRQTTPKPVEIPKPMTSSVLTPPVEIPKDVPKVESIPTPTQNLPVTDPGPVEPAGGTLDTGAGDALAGVAGGVEGGVAGGVVGGEIGGVQGGELGGVVGGQVGGVLGGQVGGTGTGTEGTGTGGNEAPPEPEPAPAPSGPLRVGGNVKAPVVVDRADPVYTETARKARVQGVVIVEAIIDKQGNVDNVKIVKGLPGGLSEEAMKAVRKWKFKPGTMNGVPVATIFNLTVNFQMNGGG
jgi:periplasmic protein TonB